MGLIIQPPTQQERILELLRTSATQSIDRASKMLEIVRFAVDKWGLVPVLTALEMNELTLREKYIAGQDYIETMAGDRPPDLP